MEILPELWAFLVTYLRQVLRAEKNRAAFGYTVTRISTLWEVQLPQTAGRQQNTKELDGGPEDAEAKVVGFSTCTWLKVLNWPLGGGERDGAGAFVLWKTVLSAASQNRVFSSCIHSGSSLYINDLSTTLDQPSNQVCCAPLFLVLLLLVIPSFAV